MRSRLLRNVSWSLAVLAVLVGLSLGLPALDGHLASSRPVASGVRYVVGAGVSLVPPEGAELDVTHTAPGDDRGSVLFLLRGVRYTVLAEPYEGGLDEATSQLRARIRATRGYQVTGAETSVRTQAGVVGRQGGYTSPAGQGRYAAFLHAGTAVQVTFAGGDLELHDCLPALEASILSITFGGSE